MTDNNNRSFPSITTSLLVQQITDLQKNLNDIQARETATINRLESLKGKMLTVNIGGTKFFSSLQTLQQTLFFQHSLDPGRKFSQEDGTLFVDRDPKHFPFILYALRYNFDQNVFKEIRSKTTRDLEEILEELRFYDTVTKQLDNMIYQELCHRIDTNHCSPTLEVSSNDRIVLRKNVQPNEHHQAFWKFEITKESVKNPIFFEFRINSLSGDRIIMFGVTSSQVPLKCYSGSGPAYPGFSYYGHNGQLYQNGAGAGFGEQFTAGDYVGMKIFLENDAIKAKYYKNRIAVANAANPITILFEKSYVSVNLYVNGDTVESIYEPELAEKLA